MKEKVTEKSLTDEMVSLIPAIVFAARTGDYAEAARNLNLFLQKLQQEISKGYISAENLSKITYSLETLLAMQQMENWVAFADILEYEFLPLWHTMKPG